MTKSRCWVTTPVEIARSGGITHLGEVGPNLKFGRRMSSSGGNEAMLGYFMITNPVEAVEQHNMYFETGKNSPRPT